MALSLFTRSQIITLFDDGYTQIEILLKLTVHKSTVSMKLSRYAVRSTVDTLKKSGRLKHRFSVLEETLIKNLKTSLRKCATHILVVIRNSVAYYTTVRNTLNKHIIFVYSFVKKPILTKRHIKLSLTIS